MAIDHQLLLRDVTGGDILRRACWGSRGVVHGCMTFQNRERELSMTRNWFQTLCASLAAAAAVCAAGAAQALTLGPSLDFYQVVTATDPSPLYATAWAPPAAGAQQPALRGQVQITLAPGVASLPVIGIGYLSSATGRFDTGVLTFTSVFGVASGAPAAPYPGDGWDPPPVNGCCGSSGGHDQLRLTLGPYTLEGASGSIYESRPVRLVALADLPAVLGSEFDLSPFSGDPATVLHVFQIDLPASALLSPVPEPGSALLLAAGLSLLARRRWQQRAAQQPDAPAIV
jgi:hypothetical protein